MRFDKRRAWGPPAHPLCTRQRCQGKGRASWDKPATRLLLVMGRVTEGGNQGDRTQPQREEDQRKMHVARLIR